MTLNLSIATTDYDHFRDFRLGLVKAEGIEHTWLDARSSRMLRALHGEPRVRRVGAVVRQVPHAGEPTRLRHRRAPGRLLQAVPLLVLLREQEERDRDRGGSEGEEGRVAGVGALSSRVHARLDAQRDGRGAHRRALVSGRRQLARAGGEGRAQSPRRRQADPGVGQEPERDARRSGNRLRDHRPAADLFSRRPSRRGAPLSRLSVDGGGVVRAHARSGRSCTSSR